MHVNHKYVLHKAGELARSPEARILDFGCGNGEVVQQGRKQGLDFYGVDSFMRTGARRVLEEKGLLGACVREIQDKKIPFEDGFFSLAVSNQVLEHVEDLEGALGEVHRVLKPGGAFLALFPSRDVIREGHYGIPMSHWFAKGSELRHYYALGCRKLGMGYMKKNKPHGEWTRHAMNYLDQKTFYRSRKEIFRAFGKYFDVNLIEDDYCIYRLRQGGRGRAATLFGMPGVNGLGKEMFRRLSCLVVLARKR